LPEIDQTTLKIAKTKFEGLYGLFEDLGLTRHATKKLIRYGIIPEHIQKSDNKLTTELSYIAKEFKRILITVIKLRRMK